VMVSCARRSPHPVGLLPATFSQRGEGKARHSAQPLELPPWLGPFDHPPMPSALSLRHGDSRPEMLSASLAEN